MSCPNGFTFHELLVAMSIASTVVLGYGISTVGVMRGDQTTRNYTAAVYLAHDKMEELKAGGVSANDDRCPDRGDVGITAMGAAGGIFYRCWRVTDSPLGAHLKQMDVYVKWQDSEQREVSLSTLVYQE